MRPKDEDGMPLPAPHERLAEAPALRQAGAFALARDSRSAMWNSARRLSVLNKAIDHVVDGDAVPAWVFKKDPDRPDDHCLLDLWNLAVGAIRAARPPLQRGVV